MNNKEFYLEQDGLKIHCKLDLPEGLTEGDKCPLLILVHGFTGWMDEEHLIGITKAANDIGIAVLRPDMYGHGKSDGAFRDHTILKWITQMTAVMDYAATLPFAGRLFLAGHSQGALVAMLLGAIYQDRLDAILPLSPAVQIPEGARSGYILRMHFDPEHIIDDIDLSTPERERHLSGNYVRVAQLLPTDWAIERFEKPVLIVHGDADATVPVQHAIDTAALYKNCTLKVIPGDDHDYHFHLDEVCAAVQEFLGQFAG